MDILNKSKNFYRCVGTVYELGLKREDCEVKLYEDGKPTGEKVKAECIKGKFGVRTDGGWLAEHCLFYPYPGADHPGSGVQSGFPLPGHLYFQDCYQEHPALHDFRHRDPACH